MTCGAQWLSPSAGVVHACGVLPPADTEYNPRVEPSRIVASGCQLAPRNDPRRIAIEGPPASGTFLSSASPVSVDPISYPSHAPSGEKNGRSAPSVPGIGSASNGSSGRT
jgi:hypothetical protein